MAVTKPAAESEAPAVPVFGRVLLKLSGEALMGTTEFGLDAPTVDTLARELVEVQSTGVELALVIGGGNLSPGMKAPAARLAPATGGIIGMRATAVRSPADPSALQ